VRHRNNAYLNNRLEQDHRGIRARCRPMLERVISKTILPWPRRTPELSPLSVSHVPTCSRCHTALSPYAPDSHRARYSGGCLNRRLQSEPSESPFPCVRHRSLAVRVLCLTHLSTPITRPVGTWVEMPALCAHSYQVGVVGTRFQYAHTCVLPPPVESIFGAAM
jgi:hypothetical protein